MPFFKKKIKITQVYIGHIHEIVLKNDDMLVGILGEKA